MQKVNELKLNRDLLDKEFQGYKLSLSPVPVYSEEIPDGVYIVQPSEEQYSFLDQRIFSLHNHLVADPWNSTAVYFIDLSRKIRRSWIDVSGRLEKTVEVFELPPIDASRSEKYNASINFSSKDTCVVSDGAGTLFFVDTSNRSSGDIARWKVLYQCQPLDGSIGFSICDSRVCPDSITKVLHCVVEYIAPVALEEAPSDRKTPGFETVLTWLLISEEVNGDWTIQKEELRGPGALDYVALEHKGNSLYLISEATFRSTKEINIPQTNGAKPESEENVKVDFKWQQTYDDVILWFELGESGASKNEISVITRSTEIEVMFRGENLLKGKLCGAIDPELTTWTVSNDKLEVTVQKYLQGTMWSSFIESDKIGKEVTDQSVIEEVNAQLAHLTSDKEEAAGAVMNAMEECDASEGESRTLSSFELGTMTCTNKVHLGCQQWLLSVRLEADNVPAFCIRNDVDGCVWLPGRRDAATGEWKVDHIGTLLAFGYVQASKTNRKFSVTPSDLSYVAIVDVTGHVIIYRKGVSVSTALRNRKTGRQLREIAVQQMVNLHTTSAILGAVATDQHLFVLTKNALFLLNVLS